MASKAVVDAVLARLGTTWNGIAVVKPNETDEPPADGSPFIQVQFPIANTDRMPVDQKQYREEGGFRIVLNAVRGSGTSDVLTWMDGLSALFRDQTFSGVETLVPSTPYIDDETGNYALVSIAVPYRYQFSD